MSKYGATYYKSFNNGGDSKLDLGVSFQFNRLSPVTPHEGDLSLGRPPPTTYLQ